MIAEMEDSMVKIRISYQEEKELEGIVRLLGDAVKRVKKSGNSDGKYKKAYIDVSEHYEKV